MLIPQEKACEKRKSLKKLRHTAHIKQYKPIPHCHSFCLCVYFTSSMIPERSLTAEVKKYLPLLFLIGLSSWLARSEFTYDIRRDIREDSNGVCDDCNTFVGMENIISAHKNHKRGPGYNDKDNGRGLCILCELGYHLAHHPNSRKIGMTQRNNFRTIRGIYYRMSPEDQEKAEQRFGSFLTALLRP